MPVICVATLCFGMDDQSRASQAIKQEACRHPLLNISGFLIRRRPVDHYCCWQYNAGMRVIAAINLALLGMGMVLFSVPFKDSAKQTFEVAGILALIGFFCLSAIVNVVIVLDGHRAEQ